MPEGTPNDSYQNQSDVSVMDNTHVLSEIVLLMLKYSIITIVTHEFSNVLITLISSLRRQYEVSLTYIPEQEKIVLMVKCYA